jgi:hypothetical protein
LSAISGTSDDLFPNNDAGVGLKELELQIKKY